ncbi:DUF397 domain-containing protein [Streptomyces viridosporus]|uniref:DUF397 domain-containing protein n=1 Tax=Streptomyces viridosporus TaxID=67581 RepID=UPI00341F4E5E
MSPRSVGWRWTPCLERAPGDGGRPVGDAHGTNVGVQRGPGEAPLVRGRQHGHAVALWTDGPGRSLGAGACTGRFKSSYSGEAGGECVEGAVDAVAVQVRDAEHVRECGSVLRADPAVWSALPEAM